VRVRLPGVLAVVLAAPFCGAALPFQAADPFPIPGGEEQRSGGDPGPISGASGSDSGADPDRAVWRFGHGEGWVFRAPGVPWRGRGFLPCFARGVGVTRHPRMGAAGRPQVAVRRLVENKPGRGRRAPAKSTCVNLLILLGVRVEPLSRSFPSDRPAWGGEAW
jgi:hypothetical protein